MQHDWAIFPIPERKKLINETCDFMENIKTKTNEGNTTN